MALFERIQDAKEKLQRKTKAKKADKRASARRVRKQEPETFSETAQVTANEAKELSEAGQQYFDESVGSFLPEGSGNAGKAFSQVGTGADNVIESVESDSLGPFDNTGRNSKQTGQRKSARQFDDLGPGGNDMDMDFDSIDPFE